MSVALIVAFCVTIVAGCDDDDGESVIDLTDDAVGTCLDFDETVGAEVTSLPAVPCTEPHSHEIVGVVTSDADTYPGFEALEADAQAQCLAEFENYVGISAFDSELFVSWLVPTLTSWDRDDDREIVCVAGNRNSAPLNGSIRDTSR